MRVVLHWWRRMPLLSFKFLCYGGTFNATDGPAANQTCVDVGVTEPPGGSEHNSCQLRGSGKCYSDFAWQCQIPQTWAARNNGQNFEPVRRAGRGSFVLCVCNDPPPNFKCTQIQFRSCLKILAKGVSGQDMPGFAERPGILKWFLKLHGDHG